MAVEIEINTVIQVAFKKLTDLGDSLTVGCKFWSKCLGKLLFCQQLEGKSENAWAR